MGLADTLFAHTVRLWERPPVKDVVPLIRKRMQSTMTDQGSTQRSRPLLLAQKLELAADEEQLGFQLPPLLKQIYSEIGNGGFGPGYGLIGMSGGVPDDTGQTAPEIYSLLRLEPPEEGPWSWPEGLLPICHWGCAIYSCIDCTHSDFPLRVFDPNVHGDSNSWNDCFFNEVDSFEAWICAWADGVDLWKESYGEDGRITRILAQRAKLT